MKLLKGSSSALVPLFVLALLGNSACAYEQVATLYETNGNSHTYRTNVDDSTYLGTVDRICVSGIYGTYADSTYSPLGHETCVENTVPIRSIRFGGSNDTTQAAVSFYSDELYGGFETKVTSLALGNIEGKSFIVTGNQSWTIFEGPNFDGKFRCVSATPPSLVFWYPYLESWSNYGSIVQGCLSPEFGILSRSGVTNSTTA